MAGQTHRAVTPLHDARAAPHAAGCVHKLQHRPRCTVHPNIKQHGSHVHRSRRACGVPATPPATATRAAAGQQQCWQCAAVLEVRTHRSPHIDPVDSWDPALGLRSFIPNNIDRHKPPLTRQIAGRPTHPSRLPSPVPSPAMARCWAVLMGENRMEDCEIIPHPHQLPPSSVGAAAVPLLPPVCRRSPADLCPLPLRLPPSRCWQ